MLPRMAAQIREKRRNKARIAIVGAGNLAHALAVALREAGYTIEQVIARPSVPSVRKARVLARRVDSIAVAATRAQISAEIVWFCVPDGAIAPAAESLVDAAEWKGRIALHSSGALTSDELGMLRQRGAAVASVHPMMTFVRGSRGSLAGVPFAIEGDSLAVRTARAVVRELGAEDFPIRKRQKAAYHAWGMFASPLFCALLATTECVAEAAGVSPKAARRRMMPILQQTLANYGRMGAAESFSGPIARGDMATVQKHLEVLKSVLEARNVYLVLVAAALRHLPAKNVRELEEILES
jgi:predicted short-subunit dehydrogenase-like oxidoreductase (DUF2520 family)